MKNNANNIPLNSDFKREDRKHYLSKDSRKKYEVELINGEFFYKSSQTCIKENFLFYVITPDYKIYAANPTDICKKEGAEIFHHSYFVSGEDVIAAGDFKLNSSFHLESVSNNSGHYTPTLRQMLPALNFLNKSAHDLKYSFSAVKFEDHEKVRSENVITYFNLLSLIGKLGDGSSYEFDKLNKVKIEYLKGAPTNYSYRQNITFLPKIKIKDKLNSDDSYSRYSDSDSDIPESDFFIDDGLYDRNHDGYTTNDSTYEKLEYSNLNESNYTSTPSNKFFPMHSLNSWYNFFLWR